MMPRVLDLRSRARWWLQHVAPRLTSDRLPGSDNAHPKTSRDVFVTISARTLTARHADRDRCQTRTTYIDATRLSVPAFSVRHVVFVRTWVEVGWIDAITVVARVQYERFSSRYRAPVRQYPGETVRPPIIKPAVTALLPHGSEPRPALIWAAFIDLCPEPFDLCHAPRSLPVRPSQVNVGGVAVKRSRNSGGRLSHPGLTCGGSAMTTKWNCKACGEKAYSTPEAEKTVDGRSTADYCRDCFLELTVGRVPPGMVTPTMDNSGLNYLSTGQRHGRRSTG